MKYGDSHTGGGFFGVSHSADIIGDSHSGGLGQIPIGGYFGEIPNTISSKNGEVPTNG